MVHIVSISDGVDTLRHNEALVHVGIGHPSLSRIASFASSVELLASPQGHTAGAVRTSPEQTPDSNKKRKRGSGVVVGVGSSQQPRVDGALSRLSSAASESEYGMPLSVVSSIASRLDALVLEAADSDAETSPVRFHAHITLQSRLALCIDTLTMVDG